MQQGECGCRNKADKVKEQRSINFQNLELQKTYVVYKKDRLLLP